MSRSKRNPRSRAERVARNEGAASAKGTRYALFGIVIAALAIRAIAIFDAFWLDEIWSLGLAARLTSWSDAITLAHSNSHPLNTLQMYLIGVGKSWPAYRVLSLLSGIGAVVMAMVIARRCWGARAALVAGVLFASSFMLVVYGSEARGYAPATFFALLAFYLIDARFEQGRALDALAFSAVVGLGLLSHLTFLHVYAPLGLWSAWRAYRSRPLGRALGLVAAFHVWPLTQIVLMYLFMVRHMAIGGHHPWPLSDVLRDGIAWFAGVPAAGISALIAAALAVAALVSHVRACRQDRDGNTRWVFFVALVVCAALITIGHKTRGLWPRYFLLVGTMLLLPISHALSRLFSSRRGAMVALLLIAAIVAGNGVRVAKFVSRGRGQYLAALEYITASSPRGKITLCSDHHFRNRMVIDFYRDYLTRGRDIELYPQRRFPAGGTRWFLTHHIGTDPKPHPSMRTRGGGALVIYDLVKRFSYYGPSGWHWFVYRRREHGGR